MSRHSRFLPGLSLALPLLCLAEDIVIGPAPGAARPAPKPGFHVIVDYLPCAIYERDGVTGCFRIENSSGNSGKETKLAFTVTAFDEQGKAVSERSEAVNVPKSGFGACQHTQDSAGVSRIQFGIFSGPQRIGGATVRILRENTPWPKTRFREGRLEALDNGDVLALCVQRRSKVEDRAFAPLKWIMGTQKSKSAGPAGRSLVFVPARWNLSDPPLTLPVKDGPTAPAPAGMGLSFVALGPCEPNGAPPILRAMNQIQEVLAGEPTPAPDPSRAIQRVVVCLPPEDLETATAPRIYRIVLDSLLARLNARGLKRVVCVPPCHYGAREQFSAVLAREVNEACAVYQAHSGEAADFLEENHWRVDPAREGVYGIRPNAEGLKVFRKRLVDLAGGDL